MRIIKNLFLGKNKDNSDTYLNLNTLIFDFTDKKPTLLKNIAPKTEIESNYTPIKKSFIENNNIRCNIAATIHNNMNSSIKINENNSSLKNNLNNNLGFKK